MEEKIKRLVEILKEVEDHGIGEVKITLKEDGVWIIRAEKWTRHPSDVAISFALENALKWTFRGVEVYDTGERLLKEHKDIKL